MEVIFKNIVNKSFKFNVNESETISSIIPKLFLESKTDPNLNSIKIIHKGQILDPETHFGDYISEPKFVFMFTKIKPINNSNMNEATISSKETPVDNKKLDDLSLNETKQNTIDENDPVKFLAELHKKQEQIKNNADHQYNNEMNSDEINKKMKQLRNNIVSTLIFVRSHPQLFDLFVNNFQTFLGIMASPKLEPLYKKLVNADIDDEISFENEPEEHIDETNQSQKNTELNELDKQNIQILVALGFPEPVCIKAYLVCNKNVDLAASMLFDSSN